MRKKEEERKNEKKGEGGRGHIRRKLGERVDQVGYRSSMGSGCNPGLMDFRPVSHRESEGVPRDLPPVYPKAFYLER